jgi:antitoxin (DNA-binding transcriptional repressor) of toxin-antitoxin stability system
MITIKTFSITEARNNLHQVLKMVEAGDKVVIRDERNQRLFEIILQTDSELAQLPPKHRRRKSL